MELTDTLRPVPTMQKAQKTTVPKIRLMCKGDRAWISAGIPVRKLMGVDPGKSHRVLLLASRAQIAIIRATEDERDSRLLSTGGRINASELITPCHLRDGEVFEIPVAFENGMLVGPMPEAIFTRVGVLARKNRLANGKAA